MPELAIVRDGDRRVLPLSGEAITVGRAPDNTLSVREDPSLSRHHMVVERAGGAWQVRDLGSKNGTLVNGERLAAHGVRPLVPGDRIAAGRLSLVFDGEEKGPEVVFYRAPGAVPPAGTIETSLQGVLTEEPGGGGAPARPHLQDPALKALIRAGRELGRRRPLADLFPLILDLSIDAVGAERGALLTLEGDGLVTRAVVGEGIAISAAVRDRVLQTRSSLLVRDVLQDAEFHARASLVGQQVRAMMAAPLQTDERVIGLIYLDSRFLVRDFGEDDLNLLTVLANVAAIRIEQERLALEEQARRILDRDLQQAAEIQRRLLPSGAPRVAGLDLGGASAACRTVGGDYYDMIPLRDGRLDLVLGDVAGKGMSAALLMAGVHAQVRFLTEETGEPCRFMERLNRAVGAQCPPNRFVSFVLVRVDPRTGTLTWCNAGHNPPLLVRAGGGFERLERTGAVLGILPDRSYAERAGALRPGDLLALFSDGVTEATSPEGEEFGEERLAGLLERHREEPADAVVGAVQEAVAEWSTGAPPADDITLLIARRTDPG